MDSEVLDRFLKYVQVHTTSEKDVEKIPSTSRQFDLANILVDELKEIGVNDATVNEHCIVLGTVPSNPPELGEKIPIICFIAHIDTSPEEPGNNVHPHVINYEGGDISLPNNPNLVIKAEEIPELSEGNQIVISGGTTLLGADDKAGIAEIMTAIKLLQLQEKRHGTIKVLFTPDEEVGKGVDAVDIQKIGADYAFTIDGGKLGELETECFNAAKGYIEVTGYNIHAGYAFGKMVNAIRILPEIIKLFPDNEAPETTKDREGYYHPTKVKGGVNSVRFDFILRDFNKKKLEKKIQNIKDGVGNLQKKFSKAKISVNITKQYRNMKEMLDQHPEVIKIAEEAITRAGIQVINEPIRGGTDGSRLTFMGLPTPNIFAGGINFHSKKEFIPVYSMDKAVETILNIIDISVEKALDEK